jgi:hypothetical protein
MPDLIRHPEKTKLDYPVEPGNDKEEIATLRKARKSRGMRRIFDIRRNDEG